MTVNDQLCTELNKFPSALKVCHINAQSIPSHYDEFFELFSDGTADIIAVSETWFKPSLQSCLYSLPGYDLFRNDRIGKGGGGVAVYVRSQFVTTVLHSSPQPYTLSPEFLFVEIRAGPDPLLLGVVYRPPKAGRWSILEDALIEVMCKYHHTIILGDFNADLLRDHFDSLQLQNMMRSLSLNILPSGPTYHHTSTSHSLLDLIVVSDLDSVVSHGQLPVPGISGHDLVYLAYSLVFPRVENNIITFRDFKNFDLKACLDDAVELPWHNIVSMTDINSKISFFNDMILYIFDKHAPVRTIRSKHKHLPWLTKEIMNLRRERDRARRLFSRTKLERDYNRFKALRNKVKSMCRNAKLKYFHSLFRSGQPSSVLWANVRRFRVVPPKSSAQSISIPLDEINSFFAGCTSLPTNIDQFDVSSPLINYFSHDIPDDKFYFNYVTPAEISKVILSVSKNSRGVDGIPILFYKHLLPVILPSITHIINFSLQSGIFPDIWKFSLVQPIPKIPQPVSPSDYRPISILCSISKVLERIVHRQLTDYLNKIDFFASYQSGFRPSYSTTTALLKVTEDIRRSMDKKNLTALVLFDFSKAFDKVLHPILLKKLQTQCNLSYSSLLWFSSYLCNRYQAVKGAQNSITDWLPVSTGVPQGSVLGPLLFSIYINNVPTILSHSQYHLFADDLQIYCHFNSESIADVISKINSDISSLFDWSRAHGLLLNANKTKAILIGYSRLLNRLDTSTIPKIRIDGRDLIFEKSVRNLGLWFDNSLSWSVQVTHVCNRVFAAMHQLKRLRRFLPESLRITLVRSLILPIFDYCSVVYLNLSVELGDKLQRALNYCIRFIYDLRRDEHITPYFAKLNWLKLSNRRCYFISIFVYNIIVRQFGPYYLRRNFTLLSDIHSRSTRSHIYFLQIPTHRTQFFNSSFLVQASRLWNSLPEHIIFSPSLATFKLRAFKYFLDLP